MRFYVLCLLLVIYFNCVQGKVKWPNEYFIEGEKIDLVEHSVTLFRFWVNQRNHQARFENTIAKVQIYRLKEGNYTFHYRTNKDIEPSLVCSKIYDARIPVDPLPDMQHFENAGEVIFKGRRTDKWEYKEYNESYRIEKTIFVYLDTPLRYSSRYFNSKTGKLLKDNVVNYFEYSITFNKDVFEIDEEDCNSIYSPEDEWAKNLEHRNLHLAFNRFKDHYNKRYNESEHYMRKDVFEQNWRLVEEHNSKNLSYSMTLNRFSDRTPEEMRHINSIRPHSPGLGTHPFPYTAAVLEEMLPDIPEQFDWRLHGAVTRIKSQGFCGSCWAFATTASVEGALAVKYKTLFDLSEQSIVDCAWGYGVYGCDGGWTEKTMKYVMDYGIPTEADYGGYLGLDGECHVKNMSRTFKIKGFVAVTPMSVIALKAAVYLHGPVATYVMVTDKMEMYSHGIFYEIPEKDSSPTMVNHVVLVVGYGVRDGAPYWIVKNSYGEDWGEDGYILISATDNTGNLLLAPYYPIV